MFNLTLHDHLHLTFNEIIQRHDGHAAKAHSRARWSRRLRGGEAVLIGGVAMTAAGAALGHGPMLAIVAASLACLALIILLVDLTFDFDASGARMRRAARIYGACASDIARCSRTCMRARSTLPLRGSAVTS